MRVSPTDGCLTLHFTVLKMSSPLTVASSLFIYVRTEFSKNYLNKHLSIGAKLPAYRSSALLQAFNDFGIRLATPYLLFRTRSVVTRRSQVDRLNTETVKTIFLKTGGSPTVEGELPFSRCEVGVGESYFDARHIRGKQRHSFLVRVLDRCLPDDPNGQVA